MIPKAPNNTHQHLGDDGCEGPNDLPHRIWLSVMGMYLALTNEYGSLTLIQDIFSRKTMNIYGRIELVQHRKS